MKAWVEKVKKNIRKERGKWTLKRELSVIPDISILISVLALYFSLQDSKNTLEHYKASLEPNLQYVYNFNIDVGWVGLALSNVGTGPAILDTVQFFYNDTALSLQKIINRYENYKTESDSFNSTKCDSVKFTARDGAFRFLHFYDGAVIKQTDYGSELKLLYVNVSDIKQLDVNDDTWENKLHAFFKNIKVKMVYHSSFGDKESKPAVWELDTSKIETCNN